MSLLLVAGEASGDLHGARLLSALRARVPELEAFGLGSGELADAGLDAIADSREIAVTGIVEIARIYRRAREIFDALLVEVDRRRPRVALLIDFPEFNLRLARELKRRGVRVVYYISPQIWAWRQGRVKQIGQRVDRMLVLFPFEEAFYREHGVPVEHVGHPLVDEVPVLPQAWDESPADPPRIALLPGSRRNEVESLLPRMLEAGARVTRAQGGSLRLIEAATVDRELFEAALAGLPPGVEVERVPARERFAAIASSHLALCASGTATLEVGLLGTPLIVLYRLRAWTYWLARRLVKLPHFSLVNLVLEAEVAPELVQEATEGPAVAELAERLLAEPDQIAAMRERLGALRARLGEGGASRRAAAAVEREWRSAGGAA